RATALFESIDWPANDATIRALRAIPRTVLTDRLRFALADALITTGRYRDAREYASDAQLAQIDRRMGDYHAAIARLELLDHRDFDCELLRAEILLLVDRREEANMVLDACKPSTHPQRARLAYQRAIVALDSGGDPARNEIDDRYRESRLSAYRAVIARDLPAAIAAAHNAIASAAAIHQRVDATLDLLYTLFCAGRWTDARANALDALLLVDQTQGDRAAG